MHLKTALDSNFLKSLNIMMSMPLPATSAYWLSKANKKIQKEIRDFHEVRIKTLKKYAFTNEAGDFTTSKGEPILDGGAAVFKSDADKDAWDKEYQTLVEIELDIKKISVSSLGVDTKIEPTLLSAVDELFTDDAN